jgi:zinc transport system ATP-binding protein
MSTIARPQPDSPVLVEARGLGVRRGDRWIVRDIDVVVRRGEIVTLIGPNGGGKTTTAKALLGLITTEAGSVTRPASLKVGYVPQRFTVDWSLPLDVKRLMQLARPYASAEIAMALERVGAAHLIERQLKHLSGGELQRVLLARAIIGAPDLLVLDEPVQGVDYGGEIALYNLIREIRDRLGCGILLISHDLHIVMAGTEEVVCINGHICCSGTPEHVVGNEAFKQLFGTKGAAALAIYHHVHDHSHDHHGAEVPQASVEAAAKGRMTAKGAMAEDRDA